MLPVVLHHGLMGFTNLGIGNYRLSYFRGIDHAIQERGHPIIIPSVHPTGGIALRARQLKAYILRSMKKLGLEDRRIILIGHSMGGLDARYMISRLGMADRVAALLTVCTPHRGSPYADWCLLNLGKRMGGLRLMKILRLDVQALSDLTTANCAHFNAEVPDDAGVRYFSVSGARPWTKVPPFAMHAWRVITALEGDNDSLVSVTSSKWGKHLGVWPCDHWHSINHRFIVELRNGTGNIAPYYLKALDEVTAAVEVVENSPERRAPLT
ncbi:MAG TPA: alpha/beta fold hydrolase [Tepidisphaeraceae bacterium]|jgi:triacylglycerol lipase